MFDENLLKLSDFSNMWMGASCSCGNVVASLLSPLASSIFALGMTQDHACVSTARRWCSFSQLVEGQLYSG